MPNIPNTTPKHIYCILDMKSSSEEDVESIGSGLGKLYIGGAGAAGAGDALSIKGST